MICEIKFKFTTDHKKMLPFCTQFFFSGIKNQTSNKIILSIKLLLILSTIVQDALYF